jgi:hypothetical protein
MLPNFVCPGAQKSATTTLHDVLIQHPDVFLPDDKETHFFDRDDLYARGRDWYEQTWYGDVDDESHVGDITPRYMYYRFVPERLHEVLGDELRLIFMLRDPVERAYSQYWMHRSNGYETMSFRGAVDVELRRRRRLEPSEIARLERQGEIRGYVARGFYARQIERFLEYFPERRMLFVHFDRFVRDIPSQMERIFEFLGTAPNDSIDYEMESNPSRKVRFRTLRSWLGSARLRSVGRRLVPSSRVRHGLLNLVERWNRTSFDKPDMSAAVRRRLVRLYRDDIDRLESTTGLDLSIWKRNRG